MRSVPFLLAMMVTVCCACGAESAANAGDDAGVEATADTVRVPGTVLADPDASIPQNAGGVELGEVAPADDITFCEAFAVAPARWVDDAVIPVQYWVDTFTIARSSAPIEAAGPIDRLIDYGERKTAWNFGQLDDRPIWDSSLAADARAIADAAVVECPDLPLVAAPPERSAAPGYWDGDTPDQIAASCQSESDDVAEGIEWYEATFATPPLHQQQIETAAIEALYVAIEETGEYPDDAFLYIASDYYGVGPDGQPMAVPGGACDI